jgi:hypothetical protein
LRFDASATPARALRTRQATTLRRPARTPTTRLLGGALVVLSVLAASLWIVGGRPRSDGAGRPATYTGPDPVVGAAGDIACDPESRFFGRTPPDRAHCQDSTTAAVLARERVTAVLALGDIQYESATLDEFRRSYDRTWGALKDRTYPVLGNHEYRERGAPGYFAYFGEVAGRPGEGYYSFDVGAWHLIALNSNCNDVACFEGSEQERFLRSDLAANRHRCVLAFWHQPRFSSGPEGEEPSVAPFWDALYDAGADVVLNGHNHHYERFAPQNPASRLDPRRGIREFVVGTGGDSLQRFIRTQRNSEVRIAATFGVLLLELKPAGYEWTFVPTEADGGRDSGRATCH